MLGACRNRHRVALIAAIKKTHECQFRLCWSGVQPWLTWLIFPSSCAKSSERKQQGYQRSNCGRLCHAMLAVKYLQPAPSALLPQTSKQATESKQRRCAIFGDRASFKATPHRTCHPELKQCVGAPSANNEMAQLNARCSSK